MKTPFHLLAAGAAMVSLTQPALAQSATCIEPADLEDTITYAMPLIMQSLQSSCADVLPADSFIMAEGDTFGASFEPYRDEAWPGARRFLMTFIEGSAAEDGEEASPPDPIVAMIKSLDGDQLRPFVDGIVIQMIGGEIGPETCGPVETLLPLLAPLPPENHGKIVAAVAQFVGPADPPLCPVED